MCHTSLACNMGTQGAQERRLITVVPSQGAQNGGIYRIPYEKPVHHNWKPLALSV